MLETEFQSTCENRHRFQTSKRIIRIHFSVCTPNQPQVARLCVHVDTAEHTLFRQQALWQVIPEEYLVQTDMITLYEIIPEIHGSHSCTRSRVALHKPGFIIIVIKRQLGLRGLVGIPFVIHFKSPVQTFGISRKVIRI